MLGSGLALGTFLPGSHPWLRWHRLCNRVFESLFMHAWLMCLLILTIVELVCHLRKWLILSWCLHLHHYMPLGGVIIDDIGEGVLDADGHGGHGGGLPTVVLRPEVLHRVVSMSRCHELVRQLLLLLLLLWSGMNRCMVVKSDVHH